MCLDVQRGVCPTRPTAPLFLLWTLEHSLRSLSNHSVMFRRWYYRHVKHRRTPSPGPILSGQQLLHAKRRQTRFPGHPICHPPGCVGNRKTRNPHRLRYPKIARARLRTLGPAHPQGRQGSSSTVYGCWEPRPDVSGRPHIVWCAGADRSAGCDRAPRLSIERISLSVFGDACFAASAPSADP